MTMKRVAALVVGAIVAASLSFGATAYAASDTGANAQLAAGQVQTAASTAELAKVQKKFPKAKTVLEATNANLKSQLSAAGRQASSSAPVIVHATGAIKVHSTEVPANVILVGESTTSYTFDGAAGGGSNIFRLSGSIFGGKFNGGKCYYNILAKGTKGGGVNGYVWDVTIKGGKMYGIAATVQAKGISIANCKISGVGDCGIQSVDGSTIKLVQNCTLTNIGESGIDLIHANITTIKGNTIKGCKGHGISTDTEHAKSCPHQKTCKIGAIQNNKISACVHHGIYLESKVTVNAIKGNTIFNNKKTGINVMANATAKGIANNKIYGNAKSNITASGKNATIRLLGGNKLYNSKEHGISVSAGGKATISGANNQIYKNTNGINVAGAGCVLTITGKGTQVKNNKKNGISFNAKAKGSISNVKFSGNKKLAVYVAKGCKCTYKKCNVDTASSAANRIYFAK